MAISMGLIELLGELGVEISVDTMALGIATVIAFGLIWASSAITSLIRRPRPQGDP
jgi:hypothetical protein